MIFYLEKWLFSNLFYFKQNEHFDLEHFDMEHMKIFETCSRFEKNGFQDTKSDKKLPEHKVNLEILTLKNLKSLVHLLIRPQNPQNLT